METEEIIIIGSGPAAYSAAAFGAKHRPLLFEGEVVGEIGPGGQLTTTTNVDNYPGFPHGTQGPKLMDTMKEQAQGAGIRIVPRTVCKIEKSGDLFHVYTRDSKHIARSVIVSTGASAKRLKVPGTRDGELWQKGISACAVCDGFLFNNEVVAVIGGGDSAMEETIYMSHIAKKVYLVHRRNEFRARADMLDKVKKLPNVEIITPAVLESAHGENNLEYLKLKNVDSGEIYDLRVDGLFFGIGHTPNTRFLGDLVDLDEGGYIQTNERKGTSIDGLFACGDVQDSVYRQAVVAAMDGCIAAVECSKYLSRTEVE